MRNAALIIFLTRLRRVKHTGCGVGAQNHAKATSHPSIRTQSGLRNDFPADGVQKRNGAFAMITRCKSSALCLRFCASAQKPGLEAPVLHSVAKAPVLQSCPREILLPDDSNEFSENITIKMNMPPDFFIQGPKFGHRPTDDCRGAVSRIGNITNKAARIVCGLRQTMPGDGSGSDHSILASCGSAQLFA